MTEASARGFAWRALAKTWRLLVGAGLLLLLVLVVGPRQLLAVLARASIPHVGGLAALLAFWLWLGGLNVWILLRSLTAIRLLVFLRVYAVSWATSLLLPGQLGDATQVLFLRRYRISMATSGAAYLVDKALSLAWMTLVAAAGLALYLSFPWSWVGAAGLACCVALGVCVALWRPLLALDWGRLSGVKVRIERLSNEAGIFLRKRGVLFLNGSNTVFKWIVLAWIYRLAFQTFGHEVPWAYAATYPTVSSLAGYLPISVGGAGTMEWTAVGLFRPLGIPAADIVAAYLVVRALLLGGALLVLVFVSLSASDPPSVVESPVDSHSRFKPTPRTSGRSEAP